MNNSIAKRIRRCLNILVIPSVLFLIGYLIWASSFMVIVPPDKYDTFPDGAILWSYWPDRQDQLMAPDFIQELDLKTLIVIGYIKVRKDRKPLQLPYIRRLHEIVSGDIGQVEKEVIEPEKQVVPDNKPAIEVLEQLGEHTICSLMR